MTTRSEQKFFRCEVCGNITGLIQDAGIPMVCCEKEMVELIPNATPASTQAHIPAVIISGDQVDVTVGAVEHPMADEHYIQWVYLKTEQGGQRKSLGAGDVPKASFVLIDDKPLAVYSYCNLHGLWEKTL